MYIMDLFDRSVVASIVCFGVFAFCSSLAFEWYVLIFGGVMFLTFVPYYIKMVYYYVFGGRNKK